MRKSLSALKLRDILGGFFKVNFKAFMYFLLFTLSWEMFLCVASVAPALHTGTDIFLDQHTRNICHQTTFNTSYPFLFIKCHEAT